MAGIGFRLQKLLDDNTYKSTVQAYIYSAVISSGPWLLAIITLMLISLLARLLVDIEQISLFQCVIAYTFVGSLVLTGTVQMATTRYIADRLFVEDSQSLLPCYQSLSVLTILVGGIISLLFYAFSGLDMASTLGAVLLFESVCLTWNGMSFLSAAKDYSSIVRGFALGYGLSLAGALAGAQFWALRGLIWGFAIGQVVLAVLLSIRIRIEFKSNRELDWQFLRHWRKMPALILVGFFYNAAVWIDKIIFWMSDRGVVLIGWFRYDPYYDTSIYFAYMTIVPAMTLFLVQVETVFYKHYAAYYQVVTQRGSLDEILRHHEAMATALRGAFIKLLKIQGSVTLVLFIIAPVMLSGLGLPPLILPVFRLCLLAAFMQVLLLLVMIILLYFDWQRDVAALCVCFFVLNAVLTLVSLLWPGKVQGIGYLAAGLITLIISLILLNQRMDDLERDTFTRETMLQS